MRLLVTGGRDYDDRRRVWRVLDQIHAWKPIALIITGACPFGGADLHAENWAKAHEIDYVGCPAKFRTGQLGHGEGPARNARMPVEYRPDAGLYFPGGTGTAGMISILHAQRIPVWDQADWPE